MRFGNRMVLLMSTAALLGIVCGLRADGGAPAASCDAGACDGSCDQGNCLCDHCTIVPDVKTTKKWVYSTKLVPYCRTKCPNPLKCRHDSCETCPNCEECVRYKRVLIKREVVTKKNGYKCVPGCEACRARAQAAKGSAADMPAPPVPAAPPAPTALREPLDELYR